MACGILKGNLIVRVGVEQYQSSLAIPIVRGFDITGRPMKGWVMVSSEGHTDEEKLFWWA